MLQYRYKVAGYNPNYDCYACQRNTFSAPEGGLSDSLQLPTGGLLGAVGNTIGNIGADRLQVDVEFSMPRLLPDGSPPPPSGVQEVFSSESGLMSVGYNQYSTHETMVFDSASNSGSTISGRLGVGIDLGRFTLEVNHERSFSELLDNHIGAKNKLVNLSVGLKF